MQIYSTYRDSILQYKIYTCGFISYLVVSGLSVCALIICGFNCGALNRVALLRVALMLYTLLKPRQRQSFGRIGMKPSKEVSS